MSTTTSPITSPASTSEQWAAMLRYDSARRDSGSTAVGKQTTQEGSNRRSLTKSPRLSTGDDLPHMPEENRFQPLITTPSPPREVLSKLETESSAYYNDGYGLDARPGLGRIVTPPALKGGNAVLVDREMYRLRHRREKEVKRYWRIITGTMLLFVLGLSSFVLAKYAIAYLALSPANWVLSESANGSHGSPDPVLRTLALIEMSAAAVAVLGALSSGFYLRFSRRRSCGTWFVWTAAILSTTISLLLSVLNLALIAIWHQKYSSSSDPLAATRDVSRRCRGSWSIDLLWTAAESSSQVNASSKSGAACAQNAAVTLRSYLIAGGVRLVFFVVFCSLWLACLARYNRALQTVASSNESVMESAEMHKLLMEQESDLPGMPELRDIEAIPGSYYAQDLEGAPHRNPTYAQSNTTLVAPPPRLDRFHWQRGEPSCIDDVGVYSNIGHQHERDSSAGAWSMGVVGQVWNALWGSEEPRRETNDQQYDHHLIAGGESKEAEHAAFSHERQSSRLGVRGWFRRDTSGQASEDYLRRDDGAHEEERFLPPPEAGLHSRTPSQERRAQEGRHAAARLAQTHGHEDERAKADRRRREQQDRIEFLAGFAARDGPRSSDVMADEAGIRNSSRRSSQSAGDDLPHMPELGLAGNEASEGDEAMYWQTAEPYDEMEDRDRPTHLYVRTLGRLVRKLSAIASEGSRERADRVSRSGRSASDAC